MVLFVTLCIFGGFVISRAFGWIIVACAAYWWVVFVGMHVLEPEFDPVRAPGSAYVLGKYAGWMSTTYFTMAAMLVSAGLGLVRRLRAGPPFRGRGGARGGRG